MTSLVVLTSRGTEVLKQQGGHSQLSVSAKPDPYGILYTQSDGLVCHAIHKHLFIPLC